MTDVMKIIDTHMHLWNKDIFSYSWSKGLPIFDRTYELNEYLEAVCDSGIEQGIFVEADVDEQYVIDEAVRAISLAEQDSRIGGVVAGGRPEQNDFGGYLKKIGGSSKLKGIRRVLHTQPDDLATDPFFVTNVGLLKQYNLSFDICVLPHQLPVASKLVRSHPKLTFILDHCGIPDIKGRKLESWRGSVKEISGYPNVYCKISGLVAYADPEKWTPEDLRPFIEHVVDCFGWDRVMFGSDWPVCTISSSLKKWVDTLLFLTKDSGEDARLKLFRGNAQRIYRLDN